MDERRGVAAAVLVGGGRAEAFSFRPAGLRPDTTYQYRLTVDPKLPCDLQRAPNECRDVYSVDSTGTVNGTRYSSLTTQPVCDDVQGACESLASFIAANPAGTKGDRRVLCLRPGTQEIGQLNGLKAWSTLTPRGEADGTKQAVVLNGNVALESPGATVEDVRVVGCWRQGGCSGSRDKVIDVRASDVRLSHLDITQQGGRNSDVLQCVLIDSSSQVTNVTIAFSKIHSCGSESSGNMEHGIYCSRAFRPVISGNWIYDNEGYGVQLYPNCDGALVAGNVVAENGGSCDVDGSTDTVYAARLLRLRTGERRAADLPADPLRPDEWQPSDRPGRLRPGRRPGGERLRLEAEHERHAPSGPRLREPRRLRLQDAQPARPSQAGRVRGHHARAALVAPKRRLRQ